MTLTFPDDWRAEVLTAQVRPIMLKVKLPRHCDDGECNEIRRRIEAEFARKGELCPPVLVCGPGIDITLEYPDDCT